MDNKIVLSLIICSRTPDLNEDLSRNIQETIGVPYELIVIDNSRNDHTMFSAYNEGVERASGQLLCFMHEDVCFHSKDWGWRCEEHFKRHPDLGLIGLSGNQVMLKGRDWRISPGNVDNFIQRFETLEKEPRSVSLQISRNRPLFKKLREVVAVDGMWMVIRASLFPPLRFDEERFHHFHLYDTDISLQVISLGYKVCVCQDILLEHFSVGSFNRTYYDDLAAALDKWDGMLPLFRGVNYSERKLKKQLEKIDRNISGFLREREITRSLRAKWEQGYNGPYTEEEKASIKGSILFYHHNYNKVASCFRDAIREIRHSFDDGWLTAAEKRMFIWKAFLYQYILTGRHFRMMTR